MRASLLNSLPTLLCLLLVGQICAAQVDRTTREAVEENLQQRYRKTLIGKKALGLSGERDTVQRAGTIVTLMRDGLFGSLNPDRPAFYALRQGKAELVRGQKDIALSQGEKFYIYSFYAGSDVVTLGLLSVRRVTTPQGAGRIWLTLNFIFPPATLEEADMAAIYATLNEWLVSQEQFTSTARLAGASKTESRTKPQAGRQSQPVEAAAVKLSSGMNREQVVELLGPPQREVSFGERTWLDYSGLLIVLEEGRLASVSAAGQPPARITVKSDPGGAELYVDDAFVGSTPARLELPGGTYHISARLPGYANWERELRVLAGSQVTLRARLRKEEQ